MAKVFKTLLQLLTGTADPTGSAAGQMYYNTTSKRIRAYDGSGWVDAAGRTITVSTSDPSGGSDGDIWFKVG